MKGSVGNKRQKASHWVYCFWWSWLRDGHAHSLGPHHFHRGSRDETGSLNDVGCIGLLGSCSTKLLYQETNLGISYEDSVPKKVTQAEAETYDWIFGTYSECLVECGGGE
ncbi:hypothetical protein Pcinc_021492 [Petrolisthes cinctipes]|uniref:Uncharacterized protein n=1 Tax=Petrolisthes cinctipes TaxID=88211 RepID=A0AAE1FFM1_PETCI|nr:hypothetical protein Pcinc_021492 [Petrolisthes cinctipes]